MQVWNDLQETFFFFGGCLPSYIILCFNKIFGPRDSWQNKPNILSDKINPTQRLDLKFVVFIHW